MGLRRRPGRSQRTRRRLRSGGVEILTNSTVAGRYEDNWISISQRSHPGVIERLIKARAKTLVVAAGTIERPYVFQGNDLPGVMTSGAVQRLIRMYGVKPGTRAVVFTANESGDSAVAALQSAGISIAESSTPDRVRASRPPPARRAG